MYHSQVKDMAKATNDSSGVKPNPTAAIPFATATDVFNLLSGVLSADQAFHDSLYHMRESLPNWEHSARQMLSKHLADLLGVSRIESKIEQIGTELKKYQSRMELNVADLLPEGDLRSRFEAEYPNEKRVIARHVSRTYFKTPQKCFLQASTFLLHLAEELHNVGNGRGSIIHTNSTVFPWLLLGRDSKYSVYASCGQFHDPLCCGWLFSPTDSEAREYVQSLFKRVHDRLTTAFITPQHMTLDGRLHFALDGTAELVEALVVAASNVVILTPLQRVRRDASELKNNSHSWHSIDVSELRKNATAPGKVEFVVAGEFHKGVDRSGLKSIEVLGTVTVLP